MYYKENLTVIPKFEVDKDEKVEFVRVELLIKSQRFLIGTLDHKTTPGVSKSFQTF